MPRGYKIENGKVVIDTEEEALVKRIFELYLSGMSLDRISEETGLGLTHGPISRILANEKYLGDDFYPAIISRELFDEVAKVRKERLLDLRTPKSGRTYKRKPAPRKPRKVWSIRSDFVMGKVVTSYNNPFQQAEYLYSLIEGKEQGHE